MVLLLNNYGISFVERESDKSRTKQPIYSAWLIGQKNEGITSEKLLENS